MIPTILFTDIYVLCGQYIWSHVLIEMHKLVDFTQCLNSFFIPLFDSIYHIIPYTLTLIEPDSECGENNLTCIMYS